jgi:hypothetical protein
LAGQFTNSRIGEPPLPWLAVNDPSAPGQFTSTVLDAKLDAREAVLSLNLHGMPEPGFGVAAGVAFSGDGRRWSSWHRMLRWGATVDFAGQVAEDGATLDVDTLRLERGARHWRYRCVWRDPSARVRLRRVALSVALPALEDSQPSEPNRAAWGKRIDVPHLSQFDAPRLAGERLCSPTSVAMVSRHLGVPVSAEAVAERAFDADADLYGNWSLNVLAASLGGLAAWVDRGGSLGYLEDLIDLGQPVIASIAFAEGELEGAPVAESRGHLVVVCGFDRAGDVIVRDPAGRATDAWHTYRREPFARAWLGHGGVVYRIMREDA